MNIKQEKLWYLHTTLILLLFAPAALTEEVAIRYVAVSEEFLSEPHDIVLSPDGQQIYVADNGNDRVVVLDAQSPYLRKAKFLSLMTWHSMKWVDCLSLIPATAESPSIKRLERSGN